MRADRRRVSLSTLLAMAIAASPAQAATSCLRSGEHTLATSSAIQVVAAERAGLTETGRELYRDAFGCFRATGQRVPLDDSGRSEAIGPVVAAAGSYVAFGATGLDDAAQITYESLVLVDLQTGTSDQRPARRYLSTNNCYICGYYADVVLKPNRSVAWIEAIDHRQRVMKCDRNRCPMTGRDPEPVEIDAGRGIDSRSLELRGSRLTWRHDSKLGTAILR